MVKSGGYARKLHVVVSIGVNGGLVCGETDLAKTNHLLWAMDWLDRVMVPSLGALRIFVSRAFTKDLGQK